MTSDEKARVMKLLRSAAIVEDGEAERHARNAMAAWRRDSDVQHRDAARANAAAYRAALAEMEAAQ
jgi:hypothetical protein